jgi:hypothetical protein
MALVVVAFALLLTGDLPFEVRHVISGIGLIGAGLTAALSCRFRAVNSEGRRRRAWNLWCLACLSAAVSNLSLWINGAVRDPHGIVLGDVALLVNWTASSSVGPSSPSWPSRSGPP